MTKPKKIDKFVDDTSLAEWFPVEPRAHPSDTGYTQESPIKTLYYHTFTPEIFVVMDADGVVQDFVEVHNGSEWRYESMLMYTTDNTGEITPTSVKEKAIESFMTNFVVKWDSAKGVVYK